jgi:hypothetical protein
MPLPVALGLALVLLAFGLLALLVGWPDLRRALASSRWPRTDALIEEVTESLHSTSGRGRARSARRYHVRYSYVVQGRAHTGRWESLASTAHRTGAAPFRAGELVAAFHDPAAPAESRLFNTVRFQDVFLVLGGLVFFAAIPGLILVYLRLTAAP